MPEFNTWRMTEDKAVELMSHYRHWVKTSEPNSKLSNWTATFFNDAFRKALAERTTYL